MPLSAYPRNTGSWNGHRRICLECAAAQKMQGAARKAEAKAIEAAKPVQAHVRDAHMTIGRYGSFADMTPERVAGWARSALQRPTLRILDTETTGRGPRWGGGVDEIVEICIVDGNGAVLLNTLVKPMGTMHPDAAAKSGITDAMLAPCAPFSAVAGRVRDLLNGKAAVIFNADYDVPLIAAAFKACEQAAPTCQWRCAMLAYHTFSGRLARDKWVGLDVACQEAGISPQRDAHRALGDCLSTLALLSRMADHRARLKASISSHMPTP